MNLQLNYPLGLKTKKDDLDMHLKPSTFKYDLNCNQCSWNVSFYEVSGSIYLDSHKMLCPLCRQKDIRWIRSAF